MRGVTLVLSLGLAVSGLTAGQTAATAEPSTDGPVLQLATGPGTDVRCLDVWMATDAGSGSGRTSSGRRRTSSFSRLGLTWRGAPEPHILVRTHADPGCTRWQSVPLLSDLPGP